MSHFASIQFGAGFVFAITSFAIPIPIYRERNLFKDFFPLENSGTSSRSDEKNLDSIEIILLVMSTPLLGGDIFL
jgi:hypothetical protein